MSLDKKQGQNKLFAFEINNIMHAIRNLAQNIISLNRSAHWEFISSESFDTGYVTSGSSGSTIVTPPSDWGFAVVSYNISYASRTIEGQMIVARDGLTSQYQRHYYGVDNTSYWMRARAYVSGEDINLSYSLGEDSGTSSRRISGSIYFYK